jgi:hypothetical protein
MNITPVILFCSAYLTVFCLGMQHHFVANSKYLAAAINSTAIGTLAVIGYRTVPDASFIEMAGYIAGGPAGILSSMMFWNSLHEKPFFCTKKKTL